MRGSVKKQENFFGRNSFYQNYFYQAVVLAALVFSILMTPAVARAYDVMVGGQSLGIVLQSEGAIVVGFTAVYDENGAEVYPARDAGVAVEDMLLAINGRQVSCNQDVADIINELGPGGEPAMLSLRRDGQEMKIAVVPQLCSQSGMWRIGLYIRDANAGIGTLTFYDPQNGAYAALGHKIEENGTAANNSELGHVLAAEVQYIKSSVNGEPGEKVGVFDASCLNGNIVKNCELGIYGTMDEPLQNELYPQPLPVADADEVKPGPATMLTVLEGEQVEEFTIEIERVSVQKHSADKGMVIKITDERLIDTAGGIVQGMSGSPIIQDGKLAGAVTHVFVDDSCSGYGCFAEWMLEAAE